MKQIDLSNASVVVVLWTMQGCPSCREYAPRFKRIAAKYESCLPILVLDVYDESVEWYADRRRVTSTPTLMVLRRNNPYVIRREGALTDLETEEILKNAVRGLSCEI